MDAASGFVRRPAATITWLTVTGRNRKRGVARVNAMFSHGAESSMYEFAWTVEDGLDVGNEWHELTAFQKSLLLFESNLVTTLRSHPGDHGSITSTTRSLVVMVTDVLILIPRYASITISSQEGWWCRLPGAAQCSTEKFMPAFMPMPSCPKRKELSFIRELAQSQREIDSPRRLISIVATQAMTSTPMVDVLNSDAGGTITKELLGLTSSSSGPSVHPLSGPHLIFRLFAEVTSSRARIIPPDFFTPGQASK